MREAFFLGIVIALISSIEQAIVSFIERRLRL